jgi:hypothetical protein
VRLPWRITICVVAAAAVTAAVVPARSSSQPITKLYLDGREVSFSAQSGSSPINRFEIGPWRFGRKIRDPKPRDKRLNLYVVSPGNEYEVTGSGRYGFNCIVNALPKPGAEVEWDIYWALVLDPALADSDLKSEKDLIVATEAEFTPAEDFTLAKAPAHEVLRRYLKIDSAERLQKFRRQSGNLPRLIIVPAGIVLRARVEEQAAAASH